MITHVYNANNVSAGKFAGSEPWSVVNAGIYSHSGGAGNGFCGKSTRQSVVKLTASSLNTWPKNSQPPLLNTWFKNSRSALFDAMSRREHPALVNQHS